jgi:surface antigen
MFSKKNRGRTIRYSVLAGNAVLLLVVVAFVAQKPQTNNTSQANINVPVTETADEVTNPLDALSSADIAVNVARAAYLPETSSVANKADTVNAQLAIAPSDNVVTAKPQVIATALKSRADIQDYTVQPGENVSSIAAKFGITSDTIRWSNALTGDEVPAGRVLVISPINGIVYKVNSGDTIDSIVAKYQVNRDQMVSFNDIEAGNLPVGQYIVLPNAQPASRATGSPSLSNIASAGGFAWGNGAVYGGNGYDYGYCTWYVKNRRPELPNNLGNASTWKVLAQRAGFQTGNVPRAGAVIWTPPRDYYGHVGYVESVNGDGSVNVSEMNVVGWGVVSRKTLSADQAASYGYIY